MCSKMCGCVLFHQLQYLATEAFQSDVDLQTDEKMGLWRESVYCIAPYAANDSSGSDEDDLFW